MIPTVVGMRQEHGPAVSKEVEPRPADVLAPSEEAELRPWGEPPVAPKPMPHAGLPAEGTLSARVRARLRAPQSLREAFVVREILDRPVGLRRGRKR